MGPSRTDQCFDALGRISRQSVLTRVLTTDCCYIKLAFFFSFVVLLLKLKVCRLSACHGAKKGNAAVLVQVKVSLTCCFIQCVQMTIAVQQRLLSITMYRQFYYIVVFYFKKKSVDFFSLVLLCLNETVNQPRKLRPTSS